MLFDALPVYDALRAVLVLTENGGSPVRFETTPEGLLVSAVDEFCAVEARVPYDDPEAWQKEGWEFEIPRVQVVHNFHPSVSIAHEDWRVKITRENIWVGDENAPLGMQQSDPDPDTWEESLSRARTIPVDDLLLSEVMWGKLRRVTRAAGGNYLSFSRIGNTTMCATFADWLRVYFKNGEKP